ncbi:MAG: hypothetical protein PVI43_00365 [Candidatus Bathyarchaeota archaeon]|jgi:hypothetical protein
MSTNAVNIKIFDSPEEAPNYNELESWNAAEITEFGIVGKGTAEGNPTVDIQFKDKDGNRYVAMVTGGLIEMLAGAIQGKRLRDSQAALHGTESGKIN